MNAFQLPGGLNIRPSTSSDVTFIEELYTSLRDDLNMISCDSDFVEELKHQQFIAQTSSYEEQFPNAMTFIIEYHSDSVGRAILDFGAEEVRLVDISLVKQVQGKGLGTAIVQSFIASAEQVRTPLRLSVLNSNFSAKQIYTKLGLVPDGSNGMYDLMVYYPITSIAS